MLVSLFFEILTMSVLAGLLYLFLRYKLKKSLTINYLSICNDYIESFQFLKKLFINKSLTDVNLNHFFNTNSSFLIIEDEGKGASNKNANEISQFAVHIFTQFDHFLVTNKIFIDFDLLKQNNVDAQIILFYETHFEIKSMIKLKILK